MLWLNEGRRQSLFLHMVKKGQPIEMRTLNGFSTEIHPRRFTYSNIFGDVPLGRIPCSLHTCPAGQMISRGEELVKIWVFV